VCVSEGMEIILVCVKKKNILIDENDSYTDRWNEQQKLVNSGVETVYDFSIVSRWKKAIQIAK
jgi:hypothetical protein